jgi:hypothetical protein
VRGIASIILLFAAFSAHAVAIDRPRMRPSPYFGSISGIDYADLNDLGKHNYDSFFGEKNPLIYTAKAGYIDIGHLRESADRTRYLFEICNNNIAKKNKRFSYKVVEKAIYRVTLEYPDYWDQLSDDKQRTISREISIDLAQYFAQQSTIWHEIVTWYGYSSIGLLSEKPSSFSWEDTYSDLLGTKLAAMVLRENPKSYNEAMKEIISRELAKLRPQSAQTAKKATKLIKGKWYSGTYPFVTMKKRNFDVGFEDKAISPFRVPGVYSEVQEQLCTVPSLGSLDTYGFKMHLQMKPKESQKKQVLKIVYPDKKGVVLQPAIHFPIIIAHIRQEAIREVGQDVDRPTLKNAALPGIALSKAY